MDGVQVIALFWAAGMTAAVVFLLWRSDDVVRRQAQSEVMLRKLQESTNAFAALVERMASRGRNVQKSKAPKGK